MRISRIKPAARQKRLIRIADLVDMQVQMLRHLIKSYKNGEVRTSPIWHLQDDSLFGG